jgi:adenylate kinase
MNRVKKAYNFNQIYGAFRNQPLAVDELDDFFVNADSARGIIPVTKHLAVLLDAAPGDYQHILLVGYKGCGKSTELNRLQRDISNRYAVLNYSVFAELDAQHIHYIELFIVTLEKLFELAEKEKLDVSGEYIKSITHWMQTKEIKEIRNKYSVEAEGEVGMDGNIGVPYLKKFFYKFKMTAKSSRSLKETLKTNVEPKLTDLIERCNELIAEVKFQLRKKQNKDLLIIIEDLDKIPIERANDLFFNYAGQITQLKANVIYTFPITTYYNIRFNNIRNAFTRVQELPMIKLCEKDGRPYDKGRQLMKEIVEKRMDTKLFADETLLESLIDKSGGCIRDLFYLITEAATAALITEKDKITKEDCIYALNLLKKDYSNTIADNSERNITAEQYFNELVALAQSSDKKPDNSEAVLDLRQNLCILGYNGEGWCDVHPLVKDILIEKGKWKPSQPSN